MDDVMVRAEMIDMLLSQIHSDILYLEQRIKVEINAGHDSTAELNSMAVSNPLYHHIAWLDIDGQELGGYRADWLEAWTMTDDFQRIADAPINSIRFMPILHEDDQTHIIAGVRLQTGVLIIDINAAYLLQCVDFKQPETACGLFLGPEIMISSDEMPEIQSDQLVDSSGYVRTDTHLILYQRVGPGGEWGIVRTFPTSMITADLTAYHATFFALLMGGMASITGLALFAIARIIDPVYQLGQMVDQLRHGISRPELPHYIPDDEFGKLIYAFDQMADELHHTHLSERALIEQLIRAQEEERKLIAYDLHDGLIQQLVGARFYIGHCRKSAAERMGQYAEDITRGYDVLTTAIAEGRRLIQGLHPTVLEDLGLEAALNELGKSTADTAKWDITLDIASLDPQPDRATSVTLYRITQEALNNAFKHAQAARVWLTLTTTKNTLTVCVRDDGQGFDVSQPLDNNGKSWGIRTMNERAAMLGGTCEITSEPGVGTMICVTVPYAKCSTEQSYAESMREGVLTV